MILSMESDIDVVGQACDGMEAVEMALALRPDVILMDLHMPRQSGVAATRQITRSLPTAQVLVLTTLDDDETVFEAIRAGALGYLLKDVSEDELLDTIRALRRGESRLTPQIARKVMDQFRRMADAPTVPAGGGSIGVSASVPTAPDHDGATDTLSAREEEVLKLIIEGLSNRQIAQALSLAEGTIKNYVSRIMEKLHANTRTALAVMSDRRRRRG